MTNSLRLIALLIALTVVARVASAQANIRAPQFDEPPFDGPSFLKIPLAERGPQNRLITAAANVTVQKELGLSDIVAKRLSSLPEEYRNNARTLYAVANVDVTKSRLTAAESQKTRQIQAQLIMDALREIEQLLSPEQFSRLKQIRVQWYGIDALRVPDLAAELKLTDDQQKRISELTADYLRRHFSGLPAKGQFNAKESKDRAAKVRELNKERDQQILNVLTAEQQSQFAAMQGTPFDVQDVNQDELRAAGMISTPPVPQAK